MEKYRVTLETLGPVFIGGGETLRRGEYIYEKKQNHVKVKNNYNSNQRNNGAPAALIKMIDMEALLKLLIKENLVEEYFDNERGGRLKTKLQLKKQLPLLKDGTLAFASNDSRYTDIELFIRNGLGEKYIPGSSLKGAFRTVIESQLSLDAEKMNLLFRGISFSDSDVILNKNFKIYKKYDFNPNKTSGKQLPLYRECIAPNVQIKFDMVIDETVIDLPTLQNYLHKFYQNYRSKWLDDFVIAKRTKYASNEQNSYIYLGGGVGFVSKTVHYQKNQDKMAARKEAKVVLEKKFPKIKYDIKSQPVPGAAKYTKDGMRDVEFGLCAVKFKKV